MKVLALWGKGNFREKGREQKGSLVAIFGFPKVSAGPRISQKNLSPKEKSLTL